MQTSAGSYHAERIIALRGLEREDAHLRVIHAALELLREALQHVADEPAVTIEEPPSTAPPVVEAETSSGWLPGVDFGSGTLASAPSFGWLLALDLVAPLVEGWALTVGGMVSAPFGLPDALSILEGGAWGGVRHRCALTAHLHWGARAGGGVWIHHYDYRTSRVVDTSDTGVDLLGVLQLELGWHRAWFSLDLAGGILVAPEGREHSRPGRVIWTAESVRVFVLLRASVDHSGGM